MAKKIVSSVQNIFPNTEDGQYNFVAFFVVDAAVGNSTKLSLQLPL